jgi:hypothetical protein
MHRDSTWGCILCRQKPLKLSAACSSWHLILFIQNTVHGTISIQYFSRLHWFAYFCNVYKCITFRPVSCFLFLFFRVSSCCIINNLLRHRSIALIFHLSLHKVLMNVELDSAIVVARAFRWRFSLFNSASSCSCVSESWFVLANSITLRLVSIWIRFAFGSQSQFFYDISVWWSCYSV